MYLKMALCGSWELVPLQVVLYPFAVCVFNAEPRAPAMPTTSVAR